VEGVPENQVRMNNVEREMAYRCRLLGVATALNKQRKFSFVMFCNYLKINGWDRLGFGIGL
jgi:hypothetical protein